MSGLIILLCAIAGAGHRSLVVDQHVDLIEINHYHDATGRRVLNQAIFYRWSAHDGRYHAHAWRLVKDDGQLPVKDASGGYVCIWHDDGVLRRVRAAQCIESWTQVDPEKENRKYFPQNARSELAKRVPRPLPGLVPIESGPRSERIADEGRNEDGRRR